MTVSPVLPYVTAMNWETFAIALNLVLLTATVATFAFVLVQ